MKHFLLFYALLLAFGLQAKTIYINSQNTSATENGNSWSTGYKTLKAGMAAARDNDEVWITSGNYTIRTAAGAPTLELIGINYSIKIYGGFAGTENSATQRTTGMTVISGLAYAASDTTHSVNLISLAKGLKVTFDRLTFSGINSANTDNDKGGAVLVDTLSLIHFNRCIFTNNNSNYRVSCLNAKGGSEIFMDSCVFTQNGDAYAFVFTYDNTKFHLSNSEIFKNNLSNFSYFYINAFKDFDANYPHDTMVTADHINFHDNGGMNFIQRDKGTVICRNSNFSMGSGNAIYTGDGNENFTLIENCNFSPGTPENYVVYNYKNNLIIKNSVFDGGLQSYNTGIVSTTSPLQLINTTFKNFSYFLIEASLEDSTDEFLIDGCIFDGNAHDLFSSDYVRTTVRNTTFKNNDFGNGNFPLFACYGKYLVMKNNLITGNSVNNNIPLINNYNVDSTLVDSCIFENNQTKNWPLITADSGEFVRFSHSKFFGNFSTYNYMPDGMIISVYDGHFLSYSNLYKGNHSVGEAGSGVADVNGTAIFLNDIFDGNAADSSAALMNSGTLLVANCDFINQNGIILKNRTEYDHYSPKADFINTAIFSKSSFDFYNENNLHLTFNHCYSNNLLPGTGNIQSSINPVDTNYLANPAGALIVDRGSILPDSISTNKDYYGHPRVIGIIDIGATEMQNLTAAEIPADPTTLIYLYPNPAGKGIVKVHSAETINRIELYQLSGEKIQSTSADELDTTTLIPGVYLVKIYTQNATHVERLLVY